MAEEQKQGGFPQNEPRGQDPNSTTGDGHPPRPSEKGTVEGVAGQGLGQGGGSSGSGSTPGGGQGSGGGSGSAQS
jgi:serine/threonine-protein kinase